METCSGIILGSILPLAMSADVTVLDTSARLAVPASETRFLAALAFTLKWEGGFANNPFDPGGATNMGITQAVYDAWRLSNGHPTQSVEFISISEVQAIYKQLYWDKALCSMFAAPLDAVQFDSAVNFGVRPANKLLQTAVNDLNSTNGTAPTGLKVDGILGPVSLAAIAIENPIELAGRYMSLRVLRYIDLAVGKSSLLIFLRGWLHRSGALLGVF